MMKTKRIIINALLMALVVPSRPSAAFQAVDVIVGEPPSIERSTLPTGRRTGGGEPRGGCGALTLTQNTDPETIIAGNSVACAGGGVTTENAYARSFDLSVGPTAGQDFTVNCVDFGVESNNGPDYTVTINIYRDSDGGEPTHPGVDLVLLGSQDVTIPAGASLYVETATFAGGILVPADSVMVIELWQPNRWPEEGGDGGAMWPGSNDLGESAPSYIRADSCDIPNYVTLESLGFPDMHFVVRVDGDLGGEPPTGACCVGNVCSIETQADCDAMNGTYLGDDTSCNEGAGDPIVYDAEPNLPIPDCGAGSASDIINVPDSGLIGDVDIDLVIEHTWVGDLCVTITHGDTSVMIVDRPGEDTGVECHEGGPYGCSEDNYDIILDDEGNGGSIEDQCYPDLPSPPNYTPNNPLSAFDGMNMMGDWTITVVDNSCLDTGTLVHWSLHLSTPGPNPCEGTGACCFVTGTCTEISEADCANAGGAYQGDDTTCSPNPCSQPIGACCDTSAETCTDGVTQSECVGPFEVFMVGVSCGQISCNQVLGACCGLDFTCTDGVTQAACAAIDPNATWTGGGTCAQDCIQPTTGACCFSDGFCDQVPQADCADDDGTYQGDGTECASTPCPQPPSCIAFPGDMDGDGTFSGLDVKDFVACVLDPANGEGLPASPGCECADMDDDDDVDFDDIGPFVAELLSGSTGLDCWTPVYWKPKHAGWLHDEDGNFVEDEIDAMNPNDVIDLILALNACPTEEDLGRFAAVGTVDFVGQYISIVALMGVTVADAVALGADFRVAMVNLDHEVRAALDVSVGAIRVAASSEYSPDTVEDAFPGIDGTGINIAILDTGVDNGGGPGETHDLLPESKFVGGYNAITNQEEDPDDENGHGTGVAMVALGLLGGPLDLRGVATGAGLVDIKVLDDDGDGSDSDTIQGLEKCIDRRRAWDIGVINMSLYERDCRDSNGLDPVSEAVNRAAAAGMVVTVCIGNSTNCDLPDETQRVPYPGAADHAITVAASGDDNTVDRTDDFIAPFSLRGPRLSDGDNYIIDERKPDVAAPGVRITTAQHNNDTAGYNYVELTGTSMAAPHVAGVAALMLQANPSMSPGEVKVGILFSAESIMPGGPWDIDDGWGLIDGFGAMDYVPPLPDFDAPYQVNVGYHPVDVVAGDIDGDGALDLVVANSYDDTLSIVLGDGIDGFGPGPTLATWHGPNALALADFDGQNGLDIAVVLSQSSIVQIFQNDGNGGFPFYATVSVGGLPLSIAVGDLNGDGRPDISTASLVMNRVVVAINAGFPGFFPATTYQAGTYPSSVAIADVDADGDLDLAVGNMVSSNVSILTNDGQGDFDGPRNYSIGTGDPSQVRVTTGDFDHDGDPDLVVTSSLYSRITVLLNDGEGRFSVSDDYETGQVPAKVAAGDIDRDGHIDLVIPHLDEDYISVRLNNGLGDFSARLDFPLGTGGALSSAAVAVGAFDYYDTRLDIAVAEVSRDQVGILMTQINP